MESQGSLDWDEYDRFAFLLGKYGRYIQSKDFGSFRVHSYSDILLDRPWVPFDHLEPLSVVYDGGIELTEVALGRGHEQLAIEAPISFDSIGTMWAVLRWKTAPELETEYAVSLRLRDADAAVAYSKDLILWKPDHSVTGDGGPADQFDTWMSLDIPKDLPPGVYEFSLTVYDAVTLKPTVELGVWEPERTFARLQVGAVQ